MQDPGILQDQFTGIYIPNYFSPVSKTNFRNNNRLINPFFSTGSFRKTSLVYLSFRFRIIWSVLGGGVVNTTPNPQPGGPGRLF
jgi:hypothetical protein